MTDRLFPGKVGLQQRVFPFYRAPFVDMLAEHCRGGLGFFAGDPRPGEPIEAGKTLKTAIYTHAENIHLFGGPFYICRQNNFMQWLEELRPNVLIAEANSRYISTTGAIRWMHGKSRPVLGWGLGVPALRGWLAPFRNAQRKRFLRQFDGLIAYSRAGAEEYVRIGVPSERVFIACNAVTSAPVQPPPERSDRQKLSILFVGRLQARKRLDLLVEVCSSLPQQMQPELVIVGDGPERLALEQLTREIYPQAVFPGLKIGSELDEYFSRANLFVLPGTGGLAVQQAMANGLPVVVAEGDGTQSNLVRAENGWHVIPGDREDLRRVLLDAGSDLPRLDRMGKASYQIVKHEINLERMVDTFLDAMERVSR